jgi:hypothetical protein
LAGNNDTMIIKTMRAIFIFISCKLMIRKKPRGEADREGIIHFILYYSRTACLQQVPDSRY